MAYTRVDPHGAINWPLDASLYQGGSTFPSRDEVPFALPVAINDHAYKIDFSKYRRTTLQIRRLSSDDSVEPGESTLNATGVWPRAQDNWFLGQGQMYLDNRFAFETVYVHSGEYPSVRTRYWKGMGVNPWQEGQLSLQPEYESIASGTSEMIVISCGTYLYYSVGAALYFTNAPTPGVPSFTQVTTTNTNTIVSLASDGSRVWFACGSKGVFVTTAGSTASAQAAEPAALSSPQGLLVAQGVGTVNNTNLPTGSTTFYITCVDAFGNETAYTSITITVASTPINLTWNPNTNATSFNVYRASNKFVTNVTSPSFVDDGTIASTTRTAPSSNGTGSSVYPAIMVGYAKGHLLASTGTDLVEILANGSTNFIFQNQSPNFVWTCVCETPTAILVGGNAGNISYIGAIQPNPATSGATLASPVWATTLPPGETVNAMAYSAGSMLLGTSMGIRGGTRPDSTGVFDVNPVITDPGAVLCLAPWEACEYFGWSNCNPSEIWLSRLTTSGIGRADLSQYTTSGVPGYATDVMSTITGQVTSIAVLNGVPYFIVKGSPTSWSLWGPDGNVVPSGWLEPGWVRYGTLENKILSEIDFQCLPLPAGASISFGIVAENYSVTYVGTLSVGGQTTIDEPFFTGLQTGQRFQAIITLTRDTTNKLSPTLTSWVSKAMVVPRRQDEILLPIILKTEVSSEQPSDHAIAFNTNQEFLYLKSLETIGAPVTYTEMSQVMSAYIDQVMVSDISLNDDRTWWNALVTVKLLTLSAGTGSY